MNPRLLLQLIRKDLSTEDLTEPLKDLNITISLPYSVYSYKDSLSGNVTITYLNGTHHSKADIGLLFRVVMGSVGESAWNLLLGMDSPSYIV